MSNSFTFGKHPAWSDHFLKTVYLDGFFPAEPDDVTSFNPLVDASKSFVTLLERAVSNSIMLEGFNRVDTLKLSGIVQSLRDYSQLCQKLPPNMISYDSFKFVLSEISQKVQTLRQGDSCIIPMGWFKNTDQSTFYDQDTAIHTTKSQYERYKQAEDNIKRGGNKEVAKDDKFELMHHINIVITHHADVQGACTVSIVNLGANQGLEYHPCVFRGETSSPLVNTVTATSTTAGLNSSNLQSKGAESDFGMNVPSIQYQPVFIVEHVPLARLRESWLWMFMFGLLYRRDALCSDGSGLSDRNMLESFVAFVLRQGEVCPPQTVLYERLIPALNNKPLYYNLINKINIFGKDHTNEKIADLLLKSAHGTSPQDDDDDENSTAMAIVPIHGDSGVQLSSGSLSSVPLGQMNPNLLESNIEIGLPAGITEKSSKLTQPEHHNIVVNQHTAHPFFWTQLPICGDPTRHHLMFHTIKTLLYTTIGAAKANHVLLLVLYEGLKACEHDLQCIRSFSYSNSNSTTTNTNGMSSLDGFTSHDYTTLYNSTKAFARFITAQQMSVESITSSYILNEISEYIAYFFTLIGDVNKIISNANTIDIQSNSDDVMDMITKGISTSQDNNVISHILHTLLMSSTQQAGGSYSIYAGSTTFGKALTWEESVIPPSLDSTHNSQQQLPPLNSLHMLDNRFNTSTLAGDIPPVEIFRPIEFTLVPDHCASIQDVQLALRYTDYICTLLSYQSNAIKNIHLHRVSFIQYVFTRVVPVPLPTTHKLKFQNDFWYSQSIRHSDQIDILRLLHNISKHFTSSALSLHITRSFDAKRILTMSTIAAISDCVMRLIAVDSPSRIALHYNGLAGGPFPQQPFGFDVSRSFLIQSQVLQFTDPYLVAIRTQVLDYFYAQRKLIPSDHIIFDWSRSMSPTTNDIAFLKQICWEIGFPKLDIAKYLSGDSYSMIEFYPELQYFRDIIFLFKYMLSPDMNAFPEVSNYHQDHAKLSWSFTPSSSDLGVYTVKAFHGMELKCITQMSDADGNIGEDDTNKIPEKSKGVISSLLSYVFSSSQTRAPPSGADPSVLIGQKVSSEDDILHIRTLPSFDNRLSQSDSELLLSYLTAPYLRIPLILQFFGSPERIHALYSPKLRGVIDACLFEPGLWQPDEYKVIPDQIPTLSRDFMATPVGLLFNELSFTPQTVIKPVIDLLQLCIDMDTGKYNPYNAPIILYIIRLAVRVEAFMVFLLRHQQWIDDKHNVCGVGPGTYTRGLFVSSPEVKLLLFQSCKHIRSLVHFNVFPMLQKWIDVADKKDQVHMMCICYAHVLLMYSNITAEELNDQIVETLLLAQIQLTTRYVFRSNMQKNQLKSLHSALTPGLTAFDEIQGSKKTTKDSNEDHLKTLGTEGELYISEIEIFDIISHHRNKILNWIEHNAKRSNIVMDNIVHIMTRHSGNTNPGNRKAYIDENGSEVSHISDSADTIPQNTTKQWYTIEGRNCRGRYIPVLDLYSDSEGESDDESLNVSKPKGVQIELIDDLSPEVSKNHEQTLSNNVGGHSMGSTALTISSIQESRNKQQRRLERFKMKNKNTNKLSKETLAFGHITTWTGSDEVNRGETEINIQLGQFTLTSSKLQILGDQLEIANYPDICPILAKLVYTNFGDSDFSTSGVKKKAIRNQTMSVLTAEQAVGPADGKRKDNKLHDHTISSSEKEKDFILAEINRIQSAPVAITLQRHWYTLIGRNYDIHLWRPTLISIGMEQYTRPYSQGAESWIVMAIEPILNTVLKGMQVYLPNRSYSEESDNIAVLRGRISHNEDTHQQVLQHVEQFQYTDTDYNYEQELLTAREKEEKEREEALQKEKDEKSLKGQLGLLNVVSPVVEKTSSYKEIHVYKHRSVVQVYNIIEYGRRFYRQLVYTSDVRYCNQDMPNDVQEEIHSPVGHLTRYSNGIANKLILPQPSAILTRNLNSTGAGEQTYIPLRFLMGLVPWGLLKQYDFWQYSTNGWLRGYPKSNKNKTYIDCQLDVEQGCAKVVRYHVQQHININTLPPPYEVILSFNHQQEQDQLASSLTSVFSKDSSSNADGITSSVEDKKKILNKTPEEYRTELDNALVAGEDAVLTLIPLLGQAPTSPISKLADYLVRLDNIGNVLVWTRSKVASYKYLFLPVHDSIFLTAATSMFSSISQIAHKFKAGETGPNELTKYDYYGPDYGNVSIDIIEFSRLSLTFKKMRGSAYPHRLYSQDHNGMFISNTHATCPHIAKLIQGLPNAMVLESENGGDFNLLIPSVLPQKTHIRTQPLHTSISYHRSNKLWWDVCTSRHCLYPVHPTRQFISTPTLVGSIYLLLMKLLTGKYIEAIPLMSNCVSDGEMSLEEFLLWQQCKYIINDMTPDAHAAKLKLLLTAYTSPASLKVSNDESSPYYQAMMDRLEYKQEQQGSSTSGDADQKSAILTFSNPVVEMFDLGRELENYLKKYNHISAGCRLTIEEIIMLLEMCTELSNTLIYYLRYFKAVLSLSSSTASPSGIFKKNIVILPAMPSLPVLKHEFYSLIDQTVLGADTKEYVQQHITGINYVRPDIQKKSLVGGTLIEWLLKQYKSGFSLKTVSSLGFVFFYELLTNQLPLTIGGVDTPFHLGYFLLHFLPPKEYTALSSMMSILRVMMLNPRLSQHPNLPSWGESKSWFSSKNTENIKFYQSIRQVILDNKDMWSFGKCYQIEIDKTQSSMIPIANLKSGTTLMTTTGLEDAKDHLGLNRPASLFSKGSDLFKGLASSVKSIVTGNDKKWYGIKAGRNWLVLDTETDTQCDYRILKPMPIVTPFMKSKGDAYISENTVKDVDPANNGVYNLSDVIAFATYPLAPVGLSKYITYTNKTDSTICQYSKHVPHYLQQHRLSTATTTAQDTIKRATTEIANYIKNHCSETNPELLHFNTGTITSIIMQPVATNHHYTNALNLLTQLQEQLTLLYNSDNETMHNLINVVLASLQNLHHHEMASKNAINSELANDVDEETKALFQRASLIFTLSRLGGIEPTLTLPTLLALTISTNAYDLLHHFNPFLSDLEIDNVIMQTSCIMLYNNRMGHILRSLASVNKLLSTLNELNYVYLHPALYPLDGTKKNTTAANIDHPDYRDLVQIIPHDNKGNTTLLSLQSQDIVAQITTQRHYITVHDLSADTVVINDLTKVKNNSIYFTYDPRFLLFEFIHNLVLRKQQVESIDDFINALNTGNSLILQSLMGSGKTTTISPLLALLLSSKRQLIISVVPPSLLEFSRSILRSKFSSIVIKPIYTFNFDRFTPITEDVYRQMIYLRNKCGIVISTPSSIKSFALKLIETLHEVDTIGIIDQQHLWYKHRVQHTQPQYLQQLQTTISLGINLLTLWREQTVLFMDECDIVLNPLRSELNYPIGIKLPLDLAESSRYGNGLRWEVPFILLDALNFVTNGNSDKHIKTAYKDSKFTTMILQKLSDVIQEGYKLQVLQSTPHLVLLRKDYYHYYIKPILSHWILYWIHSKGGIHGLDDDAILSYLLQGIGSTSADATDNAEVKEYISSDSYKLLELCTQWLHIYLPFILTKTNRVGYGLLDVNEIEQLEQQHEQIVGKTRRYMAIPFIGKDTPSPSSEFAHPDVLSGLSVLSYSYQGLREHDLVQLLQFMKQRMAEEQGPYALRPTCINYATWIHKQGAIVRGGNSKYKYNNYDDKKSSEKTPDQSTQKN